MGGPFFQMGSSCESRQTNFNINLKPKSLVMINYNISIRIKYKKFPKKKPEKFQ